MENFTGSTLSVNGRNMWLDGEYMGTIPFDTCDRCGRKRLLDDLIGTGTEKICNVCSKAQCDKICELCEHFFEHEGEKYCQYGLI